MCRPKTHIGPKSREVQTTFHGPRSYARSTCVSPIAFSPSHLSSIHRYTCHNSPLISSHLCHIAPHHLHPLTPQLPLCRPHIFSQPSCFLHMAITQPNNLPMMPSPCQTLIHVRYLAILAGVQLSSRSQYVEAAMSPECIFDSGLL